MAGADAGDAGLVVELDLFAGSCGVQWEEYLPCGVLHVIKRRRGWGVAFVWWLQGWRSPQIWLVWTLRLAARGPCDADRGTKKFSCPETYSLWENRYRSVSRLTPRFLSSTVGARHRARRVSVH